MLILWEYIEKFAVWHGVSYRNSDGVAIRSLVKAESIVEGSANAGWAYVKNQEI